MSRVYKCPKHSLSLSLLFLFSSSLVPQLISSARPSTMAHIPAAPPLPVAHIHGDDIITIRISSCLYAYDYKVFLCFTCPGTTLFSELDRAIKADSTWWAPAENLTIACRQGSLLGDSFKWSNTSEMEFLQTRLINEVQFDREILLAVHRTLLNVSEQLLHTDTGI